MSISRTAVPNSTLPVRSVFVSGSMRGCVWAATAGSKILLYKAGWRANTILVLVVRFHSVNRYIAEAMVLCKHGRSGQKHTPTKQKRVD